jgi:hypothetical protein
VEEQARTAAKGRQAGSSNSGGDEAPWGVVTAEERARAAAFSAWEGAGAWEGASGAGKESETESLIAEAELTEGERQLLGLSDQALLELLGDE